MYMLHIEREILEREREKEDLQRIGRAICRCECDVGMITASPNSHDGGERRSDIFLNLINLC